MSKEKLPERVNPFRYAEAGVGMQGVLQVKNMQRLCASLVDSSGEVAVDMQFGVDEQGIRYLRGHLQTSLKLQCQRCMGPFDFEIIGEFKVGILKSEEEAKDLPDSFDPVVVDDGTLITSDLIEDELIISLPIVPMHDLNDCKVKTPMITLDSDTVSEGEVNNPFKVIEILKVKRKSERNQE